MKIYHKNTHKRALYISLPILAIALLIFGIIYTTSGSIFGWSPFHSDTQDTSGDNPASNEQVKSGSSIKESSVTDNGKLSGSDQPAQPIEQPDGRSLVGVDITSIRQIESFVRISAMISSLDQDGTCTLTVIDAAKSETYTSTVGVQPQSSTSVCKGFDIPADNFSSGTSTIKLTYSSGNTYGNSEQTYAAK